MGHRILYTCKKNDEWILLATWQTNKNGTYNPTITASSGDFKWDVGGTEVLGTAVNLSLDGSLRTVNLYGKSNPQVTAFHFGSDAIVGGLDFSHLAFTPLTSLRADYCPDLTSLTLPDVITGTVTTIDMDNTGLVGIVDLTAISNYSTYCSITFNGCDDLTGISFANEFNLGSLYTFDANSSGLTTLDLSKFNKLATGAYVKFWGCPNLTTVTLPENITGGSIRQLWGYDCNLSSVDISGFNSLYSGGAEISFASNPNLTTVTFPISILSGTIKAFYFYSCNLTGSFNISVYDAFTTAAIRLNSNVNLTDIVLSDTITGSFQEFDIKECPLLNVVDFSGWNAALDLNGAKFVSTNNAWTNTEVNSLFIALDSISNSGFSSRLIYVDGNNAAPDGAGLTAKNNLIAKGFSVYSN